VLRGIVKAVCGGWFALKNATGIACGGGGLDGFSEEIQRLARVDERKDAALEALKKSLLHQAGRISVSCIA
jgi:hypothetical protein